MRIINRCSSPFPTSILVFILRIYLSFSFFFISLYFYSTFFPFASSSPSSHTTTFIPPVLLLSSSFLLPLSLFIFPLFLCQSTIRFPVHYSSLFSLPPPSLPSNLFVFNCSFQHFALRLFLSLPLDISCHFFRSFFYSPARHQTFWGRYSVRKPTEPPCESAG